MHTDAHFLRLQFLCCMQKQRSAAVNFGLDIKKSLHYIIKFGNLQKKAVHLELLCFCDVCLGSGAQQLLPVGRCVSTGATGCS